MTTKSSKNSVEDPPVTPKAPAGKSGGVLESPQYLGILVALVVILITFVLFLRGKKKGRTILFVGASESGKTAIFSQLWQGKNVDTVTSIVPNEGEFTLTSGRPELLLKDLPGNDRLRQKYWDENKAGVRGIVCVIDAAGGSKAIRDGAEVLYGILTDSVVNSVSPNVLIFANKQDLPTAKAVKIIRASLEREITTLRLTKSASLQTTGGSNAPSKALGRPDKDFDFEQLVPIKIDFSEGVGNSDNPNDLKPIKEWLEKIA
ncbi:unnamed protein product [Allacma fusca]|uniref:Signal recognition particle receptor subunit beta n=1 Tax=Allacma fusca TaxID=39272 RepID=A0A8J2J1U2_9HEXA|nr:unnamed protein product [Allacma fusca]